MEELTALLEQLLKEFPPALLIGTALGFVFLIVELRLYAKGRIFSKGRKQLEYAKKMGYVIQAKLVSYNFHDRKSSNGRTREYTGKYVYVVDGENCYKHIRTRFGPPSDVCTLYYVNNMRKAKTADEMIGRSHRLALVILPFLFAAAVAYILGYRPGI